MGAHEHILMDGIRMEVYLLSVQFLCTNILFQGIYVLAQDNMHHRMQGKVCITQNTQKIWTNAAPVT